MIGFKADDFHEVQGLIDLFGKTVERRMERALIEEFEIRVDELLPIVCSENVSEVSAIIRLYLDIRGYGPVKEESVREVRTAIETAIQRLLGESRKAA